MAFARQATTAQTWAAETRANNTLHAMAVQEEHRCAICVGPYGKSALKCRNET